MLIDCISERAKRLNLPADLPVVRDRETLAHVLASFGTNLVREVSDPTVIGVFRLAIAEAVQAPEVARAVDCTGREASRAALRKIMTQAVIRTAHWPSCRTCRAVLWRDLMVSLLLGVADRPTPPRNRRTCPRRRSRLPETSSATECDTTNTDETDKKDLKGPPVNLLKGLFGQLVLWNGSAGGVNEDIESLSLVVEGTKSGRK